MVQGLNGAGGDPDGDGAGNAQEWENGQTRETLRDIDRQADLPLNIYVPEVSG